MPQPLFEDFDTGDEVVTLSHQHVDVVAVPLAAEAVGKFVAWIDRRAQLFAVGKLESEIAVTLF